MPKASAERMVSLCAASTPSMSKVGSASAYPRDCASASAASNDSPLSRSLDDRNAAAHRGLEGDHHAGPLRGGEDAVAVLREQGLVRRDHVLAVRNRIQHQVARDARAADQLDDDVDVRRTRDRVGVRHHLGFTPQQAARALYRLVGDAGDADRPPRPAPDLARVAPQHLPGAAADRADAQ